MECEHPNGDLLGTCAVCGDMVCGECFESVFNVMICGNHENLADEGEWELIGFYLSDASIESRRFFLEQAGVASLVNEGDEDVLELYVPVSERDDAYEALQGAAEDSVECDQCRVFYSPGLKVCPVCGVGSGAES